MVRSTSDSLKASDIIEKIHADSIFRSIPNILIFDSKKNDGTFLVTIPDDLEIYMQVMDQ